MFKDKSILAIIPARGGSKGLQGKNIIDLCGKPLIAWSIETALNSDFLDEIVVSTDDQKIAKIARDYGGNVPFIRPKNLAQDETPSSDVIEHCINYYQNDVGKKFDYIVLLEPTSPLREVSDINLAIKKLIDSDGTALVGICKSEAQHPVFSSKVNKKGYLCSFNSGEFKPLRRQELDTIFFFEGTIYISDTNKFLREKTFYHNETIGYEVPKWKSLEVDDMDDWVMIEAIMKYKNYI